MKRIVFDIEDEKHLLLKQIIEEKGMNIKGFFNLLLNEEIKKYLESNS